MVGGTYEAWMKDDCPAAARCVRWGNRNIHANPDLEEETHRGAEDRGGGEHFSGQPETKTTTYKPPIASHGAPTLHDRVVSEERTAQRL